MRLSRKCSKLGSLKGRKDKAKAGVRQKATWPLWVQRPKRLTYLGRRTNGIGMKIQK